MSTVEGIRLADGPPKHPNVRRTVPTFTRPSITVDRGVKREWRTIRARRLCLGDNVPGLGVITVISSVGGDDLLRLTGFEDTQLIVSMNKPIFAFTAATAASL